MIVYVLTNTVNDKVYVGQTVCSRAKRWSEHCSAAKRGSRLPLYQAMRKYGLHAFEFTEVGKAENLEHLNEMEKAVIDIFESTDRDRGYNLTTGGDGHSGHSHSLETRLKLSLSRKGRKFGPHSEETRRKMSLALLGNQRGIGNKNSLGQRWSEERRAQWSEQQKGTNNHHFGKQHSEETKQKCREAAFRQAQERRASLGERYAQ